MSSFTCTLTNNYASSCTLSLVQANTISSTLITNYYSINCPALSGTTLDPLANNVKCYDDFLSISCQTSYVLNSINYSDQAKQNIRHCLNNIPLLTFLSELAPPVAQIDPGVDFSFDISNYIDMSNLLVGLIYSMNFVPSLSNMSKPKLT
jgi:hypothetical protein